MVIVIFNLLVLGKLIINLEVQKKIPIKFIKYEDLLIKPMMYLRNY